MTLRPTTPADLEAFYRAALQGELGQAREDSERARRDMEAAGARQKADLEEAKSNVDAVAEDAKVRQRKLADELRGSGCSLAELERCVARQGEEPALQVVKWC